jgi:drug/metabolite transporter (DMT)-like permease
MSMATPENIRLRRFASGLFIVLGALLILLAPENTWFGIVLLMIGAAVELIGMALAHPHSHRKPQ